MTRLGCVSQKLRLELYLKILGVMAGLAIMASVLAVLPAGAEGLSASLDRKEQKAIGAVSLVRVDGQAVPKRPAEIAFFTDGRESPDTAGTPVEKAITDGDAKPRPVGPDTASDVYFLESIEQGRSESGAVPPAKTTEESAAGPQKPRAVDTKKPSDVYFLEPVEQRRSDLSADRPAKTTQKKPAGPQARAKITKKTDRIASSTKPAQRLVASGAAGEKSYFQVAGGVPAPSDKPRWPDVTENTAQVARLNSLSTPPKPVADDRAVAAAQDVKSSLPMEPKAELDLDKDSKNSNTKSKPADRPRRLPVDETKVAATRLTPVPKAREASATSTNSARTNAPPAELPGSTVLSDRLGRTLSSKPAISPKALVAVHVDPSANAFSPPIPDPASLQRAGASKRSSNIFPKPTTEAAPSSQTSATVQPKDGSERTKVAVMTPQGSKPRSLRPANVNPLVSTLPTLAGPRSQTSVTGQPKDGSERTKVAVMAPQGSKPGSPRLASVKPPVSTRPTPASPGSQTGATVQPKARSERAKVAVMTPHGSKPRSPRLASLKPPVSTPPTFASPESQTSANVQPKARSERAKVAVMTPQGTKARSPRLANVNSLVSTLPTLAGAHSSNQPGRARASDALAMLQPTPTTTSSDASEASEGSAKVVVVEDSAATQESKSPLEIQDEPLLADDPARAFRIDELGPFEVIDHSDELTVIKRRSKLLRTKVDVYRTSVVDPKVCDVIQFTPREISVIGLNEGATHVTFWFEGENHRPVTYLVNVIRDPDVKERREEAYALMEEHLAELFPNSRVRLIALADKLIVKGQARDAEEASQILAMIRGNNSVRPGYQVFGGHTNSDLPGAQVINMLQIPGVHQVALKVKIAEMSRSAARNFGIPLDMALDWADGAMFIRHLIGAATGESAAGSILGTFDSEDIAFGIEYLEQHGVVRVLSEPTLVTMSGKPANFHAGGEIAIPTAVSAGNISTVTTQFRAIGASISFLPVVLDKDHIRLHVSPSFSKTGGAGGAGGLTSRRVNTTVEMREGQTFAIAGLLDETYKGDTQSNLPFVSQLLGQRGATHNESELIILVTPELMHPMEPEEVPPLPGFDVTEPDNFEFFLKGHIEGKPPYEYRSTVWPRLFRRYKAGGPAMISGPFGHAD
jgi:pilus assembly protein CpaC